MSHGWFTCDCGFYYHEAEHPSGNCPKCMKIQELEYARLTPTDISVEGHPVVFGVTYETEPGEGWKGSRFVGEFTTLEELNKALPEIQGKCPDYWVINIQWQDGRFKS